ncbi:SDR family oxidoreductase [Rhizobium sp. LEGMi135b]
MKTYFLVGAGPGIGLSTAKKFASEGYRVAIAARGQENLKRLADELPGAVQVTLDATKPLDVVSAVQEVEKQFGRIDVLHYNAGMIRNASVESQQLETFNSDLAVNIGGALASIHAVAPAMRERRAGNILLTGGGFAFAPHPDYLSISIGKAGIRALAQGLYEDFKSKGIHVATVTVGGFVNPRSQDTAAIAEAFWSLVSETEGNWSMETVYEPKGL